MKISAKLLGSVLLIFVVAFAGLCYLVDRSATSTLVSQAARQLEVVRRSRAQALSTYFNGTSDGLAAAAGGVTPDALLRRMPEAIRRLPKELASDPFDRHTRLVEFYKTQIRPKMIHAGFSWPSAEEYVSRLTPEAIALQSEYTALPIDARDLESPTESGGLGTTYGTLYARYHPRVVGFAQSFNWHDVMLVAMDGTVVYCLRKDIELGTNLRTGPFHATRLAEAFEGAMRGDAHGFFTDYAPYEPAFGAPMSFMSTPVFGLDRGELLGALVLLVPVTEIERVLTEHSGFGSTEESYVVGADLRMRSSSRFHDESTSLRLVVDTDAVRRALAGESGTKQQRDYRHEAVLSSFAPLQLPGSRWAILAEIDLDEVLNPARSLRVRIVLLFVALSAAGSILLMIVLRYVVLSPIRALTDAARRIERSDFEHPVALASGDELGQLGRVIDKMMRSIRESFQHTQARLAKSQVDLRQVSARLNDAREHERARLARDVHDHIGQSLTAVKMDIAEVRRRLSGADYDGVGARLEEMSTLVDASIDETRRLASELRPAALDDVNAIEAMRGYLLDYSRRAGITCRFDEDVAAGASPLPEDRATALFRILQEALTNVVRHAGAQRVDVRLAITDAEVTLTVHDDGRGIPPAHQRASGLGLIGMRDRALLFDGDVSITGDAGTTVTARLPLAEHA